MMIPLMLAALAALTVILERGYVWAFRLRTSPRLIAEALEAAEDSVAAVDSLRARLAAAGRPVSDVLSAGFTHIAKAKFMAGDVTSDVAKAERAMQGRAESWIPLIERRLEILDTVITAAPLMGLLGTITGMMAAFRSMSDSSPAAAQAATQAQAITGGIAEALIATATGLVIALVSLLAYNYFQARAKALVFEMESASTRFLEAYAVKNESSR